MYGRGLMDAPIGVTGLSPCELITLLLILAAICYTIVTLVNRKKN